MEAADTPATHVASPFATGPFEFVRRLAGELSAGDVKLPSFPDVVQRVKRVLDDERATPPQVGRVIAADPALAARVLRIANSATFNPAGKPVTELSAAVARLGHEVVRCAAVAFALQQLKQFGGDAALRPQLQELWRKSTLVAAVASVLARETRAANAEEALVAGLLHNVGRLYLVTRAHDRAAGFTDSALWDQVLHDWHPQIGRSILEHWRFPEPICEAVADQNAWDRPKSHGARQLPDVLVCAVALVPCVWYRELLDETVNSVGAFARLGLSPDDCRRFLAGGAEQIKQLRDALAGN